MPKVLDKILAASVLWAPETQFLDMQVLLPALRADMASLPLPFDVDPHGSGAIHAEDTAVCEVQLACQVVLGIVQAVDSYQTCGCEMLEAFELLYLLRSSSFLQHAASTDNQLDQSFLSKLIMAG